MAAFLVVSTPKPFSFPSFWMAAMPLGLEACLNPAVLENTRTLGIPSLLSLFPQTVRDKRHIPRNNKKSFFIIEFLVGIFWINISLNRWCTRMGRIGRD